MYYYYYLQVKFERLETELKAVNTNRTALRRNLLDLTELHHILGKTQDFFTEAEQGSVFSMAKHGGLEEEKGVCVCLGAGGGERCVCVWGAGGGEGVCVWGSGGGERCVCVFGGLEEETNKSHEYDVMVM